MNRCSSGSGGDCCSGVSGDDLCSSSRDRSSSMSVYIYKRTRIESCSSGYINMTNMTTFVFSQQKRISTADCGVTKVCFSQPSKCDPTASADCYFMSAMMLSPSDVAIHYEITGPSDGYISFGFSDDQIMVM